MVPINHSRNAVKIRVDRPVSPAPTQPQGLAPQRLALTLALVIFASAGWSIARLFLPARFMALASFCAAWIALYPATRFAGGTTWGYWAGGAVIVLTWLLTLFAR